MVDEYYKINNRLAMIIEGDKIFIEGDISPAQSLLLTKDDVNKIANTCHHFLTCHTSD